MIRIPLQYILEELCVFNKSDLDDESIRGMLVPMLETITDAVNSDNPDDTIWDAIGAYEKLLKGNANLESIMTNIFNEIMTYRRTHRYDKRLKMKVDSSKSLNGRMFAFIVMDLDATLEALKDVKEDEDYPDELVSENPTPEQLALHEKITH